MVDSKIKFPSYRPDGSFSVVAHFAVSNPSRDLEKRLWSWIDRWIEQKNPWVRAWSSGKLESLDYFDEFHNPPRLIGLSQKNVSIRFDCHSNTKIWKDWLVKFSKQLANDLPEIGSCIACENVVDENYS